MKYEKVKKYNRYYYLHLIKNETAREILDRGIKFIEKGGNEVAICLMEFSKDLSLDINGNVVESSLIILDNSIIAKLGLKRCCLDIELSIGAPFLNKQKINNAYCSKIKIRPIEEIRERLEKYKKKEKFELKSLIEICSSITTVEEPSTKFGIATLSYLYNLGHGRAKRNIVTKLQNAIIARERDRLFYVRNHPKQKILHFCGDATILEQIKHLEWVFLGTHPFSRIKSNAHSHSKYV